MSIATKFPKSWAVAGFDIKDPSLVLYLPLWSPYSDMAGSTIYSYDTNRFTATVTGATWGNEGRDFSGTNQYIEGPTDSTFNFTSGNFSIIARAERDTMTEHSMLFLRGALTTDGYYFWTRTDGSFRFYTIQSGANQITQTAIDEIVASTWYTLGMSRSGDSVRLYKNGIDVTSTAATHTDPTTSTRSIKIGIYDDLISNEWDGKIKNIAVWNRALTASEQARIHQIWSAQ